MPCRKFNPVKITNIKTSRHTNFIKKECPHGYQKPPSFKQVLLLSLSSPQLKFYLSFLVQRFCFQWHLYQICRVVATDDGFMKHLDEAFTLSERSVPLRKLHQMVRCKKFLKLFKLIILNLKNLKPFQS